jgi:choline dehydrogenase-like flavoprotein
VRHCLPGVGRNLQDHLDVLIIHQCLLPVSSGISVATLPLQVRHVIDYLRSRRGGLTTNGAEAGGFIRSTPDAAIPDLQFHFTPAHLVDHARNLRSAAATLFGHGYSLHVCKLRPLSRGHVALKSADPAADPLIDPNYLSDPEDMATMVGGVKAARRVLAAHAFDPYRGPEMQPGAQVRSDDEIGRFIRARAETIYHPVGTCKMGRDDMSVVDDMLRVHGLEGLRVVDASVMPALVGGNTNAPTVMIAEKAADLIMGRGHVPSGGTRLAATAAAGQVR